MPFDFLLTRVNVVMFSGLSFCAGLLLGHWLALGRDKRKEFNAITEEDYLFLHQEWQAGLEGKSYSRGELGDLALAECYFGRIKRRRFRACEERYRQAREHRYKPRANGMGVDIDPEGMAHATRCTKDLLRYLKRR
jgi:hypothetical protein